jgi:hypothetical protein
MLHIDTVKISSNSFLGIFNVTLYYDMYIKIKFIAMSVMKFVVVAKFLITCSELLKALQLWGFKFRSLHTTAK